MQVVVEVGVLWVARGAQFFLLQQRSKSQTQAYIEYVSPLYWVHKANEK
jgi:hypothetical protein